MEHEVQSHVALAYLGLSARGAKITQKALTEETLIVERMLRPDSLPCLVQDCARIVAIVKKVEFEESSQRYVVTFLPDNGGGVAETARTERVDGGRGKLVRKLWLGLPRHRAVLYKRNERVGESKKASNGFRVVLWAEDLGTAER